MKAAGSNDPDRSGPRARQEALDDDHLSLRAAAGFSDERLAVAGRRDHSVMQSGAALGSATQVARRAVPASPHASWAS